MEGDLQPEPGPCPARRPAVGAGPPDPARLGADHAQRRHGARARAGSTPRAAAREARPGGARRGRRRARGRCGGRPGAGVDARARPHRWRLARRRDAGGAVPRATTPPPPPGRTRTRPRPRWHCASARTSSAPSGSTPPCATSARRCRLAQIALPPAYAAVVSDDVIELRVAGEHRRAPQGWRVDDEGRAWVRHRDDVLGEERGHAPYPGLVCLGRDDDGRDVLVDLEAADGIVSVQGSAALAREVVAAMAVQLATAPWADTQGVLEFDLRGGLGRDRRPAGRTGPGPRCRTS